MSRRLKISLAAVTIALAGAAALSGTMAAARRVARVSIHASPNPSASGMPVTISGRLRPPSVGSRVGLWQRASGRRRFRRAGVGTTDLDGAYRIVARPRSNSLFYVSVRGVRSRTIDQRVGAAITLVASPTAAAAGEPIELSGQVTPPRRG